MDVRNLDVRTQLHTVSMGTWVSAVGLPVLAGLGLCDVFFLGRPDLLVWPAPPFACYVAFLVLRCSKPIGRWVVPLHAANLVGTMLMVCGMTYSLFGDPLAPDRLRYGVVAAFFLFVVLSYVLAAGARRLLPWILGVPSAATILALAVRGVSAVSDWLVFANPVLAVVAISALTYSTEGQTVREIAAMRTAVRRKRELERRIEDVTELNDRLSAALESLKQEVSRRRRLEDRLRDLAGRDELTGVLNRRAGLELLEEYVKRADESSRPLSLVFLDVDRLKATNDQYGHSAGDEVLRRISRAVRRQIRPEDYVSRIGGDEFVIVFEDCRQRKAISIVERIRVLLDAGDLPFPVGFSYGCFEYRPGSGLSADELLRVSDARMYEVKRLKSGTL